MLKKVMENEAPIVVAGMHRSGTSLVSHILKNLGVNIGRLLDSNYEPRFYISLNNWILNQAGTTWQHPCEFQRLLDNESAFPYVCEVVEHAVKRYPIKLTHSSITTAHPIGPWSWKDPRNTITLPIWKQLYPNLRVVYVRRNGIDVAKSLITRRSKFNARTLKPWHYLLAPMKPGPAIGTRVWEFSDAFDIWDEYCEIGLTHLKNLNVEYHIVTYEELLSRPADVVDKLAAFSAPHSSNSQRNNAVSLVKQPSSSVVTTEYEQNLSESQISALRKHGY